MIVNNSSIFKDQTTTYHLKSLKKTMAYVGVNLCPGFAHTHNGNGLKPINDITTPATIA